MKNHLRYLILLLILLFVAVNETLIKLRSTSWENTLWLRVYAVNGDGRAATETYINSLKSRCRATKLMTGTGRSGVCDSTSLASFWPSW